MSEAPPASASLIPLRVAAVVLAALGVFPLAAVIKNSPVVAWLPAAAREWAISSIVVIALCLAAARLWGAAVDDLLARGRSLLLAPSSREFTAWICLITLALALFAARYVFAGLPIGGDEMAQRFQAQLLGHGRLSAVAEPHYEFFTGIQTVNMSGRWFSQFPIGGPALLALGGLLGAPWIVNPLLAAWTAASLYRFAARTTGETTARVATLLFALSPFVMLMSGSQMNHVGALALMTFALSRLPDWAESDDPMVVRREAFLIGLGVAASATLRPYDAAAFALVIGLFQMAVARRSGLRRQSFVWQAAGGLLPVALLLFVNWRTTGAPLLFGYDALNGPQHRPGFHVDPTGNEFTPLQGVHHVSSYLLLLNSSLFAGPVPAVLLMVATLALTRRATNWDHLLLALLGALCLAYASYWAESFFLGPRFLYMGIPGFILLAARFPGTLADRLHGPTLRRAAFLALPVSIAVAWLLPAGMTRYQGVWSAIAEVRAARARQPDVAREIEAAGLTDALVFVHESWHGRLTARLRAFGAPALTAESMVRELDACGLQAGINSEDAFHPGPPSKQRVERVARRGLMSGDVTRVFPDDAQRSIALAAGRVLHPVCIEELAADRRGSTALDPFLAHVELAPDGRLGGRVVFARDFGHRNRLLLDRFGDRTWYRYRPRRGPEDHGPVFVPYMGPR